MYKSFLNKGLDHKLKLKFLPLKRRKLDGTQIKLIFIKIKIIYGK